MSETVDSGHKSNFSHTCNLLTQYLKEKGSFGDLTLGTGIGISAMAKKQIPKKQPQMTIFYAGQVIVLDDFPPDKAMEIFMFAGNPSPTHWIPNPLPSNKESLRLQPVVSDLPIARKASLARFLEKRKERITARAPYHDKPSNSKQAIAEHISSPLVN